jgi:flagellar hook-basal body complex protein FliE
MNVTGVQPSIASLTNNLQSAAVQGKATNAAETNSAQSMGASFSDLLDSLSQSQNNADQLISQLSAGENVDLSDVMIAGHQSDINFRVAVAIRDRLVDAYKEVMRRPV